MATIDRFEDLIAWQKAKKLALGVYTLTNVGIFSKDFGLRDQVRRSSISVVSNIAEGFERKGNREFLQFLYISLGSLGELKTQIEIAFELNYFSENEYKNILPQITEVRKIINGLISSLKDSDFKGIKFKYS
ncbi:MAG: four helix bundle protein [Bacteroidetes bacterium]|nr:four helix bundle protein [Bacteroidota bacterium]